MIATTRGQLLRGQTTDALGDEVDTLEPVPGVASDFAVSLIENRSSVQDPETGTWRSVTYMQAQIKRRLDIQDGDRLKDLRTGIVYAIGDKSTVPRSLGGFSSTTLELRQTSA